MQYNKIGREAGLPAAIFTKSAAIFKTRLLLNLGQPDMQPEAVSRANVERMAQAVIDLDSFDALEEI